MSALDLKCQSSFSSSRSGGPAEMDKNLLLLNEEYRIYLYFDLPAFICAQSVKNVRLVLFKVPLWDTERDKSQNKMPRNRCHICPLLDYFTPFSGLYSPPGIDRHRRILFWDRCDGGCTEIDVTDIVKAWADGEIENKGFLLTSHRQAPPVTYASHRYEIAGMRPLLRLICERGGICPPLSVEPCTVQIDGGK